MFVAKKKSLSDLADNSSALPPRGPGETLREVLSSPGVRRSLQLASRRVLALVVPLLVVGFLVGEPLLVMLAGSFAYNVWHLYNLTRLAGWLERKMDFAPPDSHGLWGEVLDGVYRLQIRHRKRKRKLARFIHEFQEASAALPVGVVVVGDNGQVEWCNPGATDLLGVNWPRDQGLELANLVRHPDLRYCLQRREDAQQQLQIISPVDGRSLWVTVLPYGRKKLRLLLVREVSRSPLANSA